MLLKMRKYANHRRAQRSDCTERGKRIVKEGNFAYMYMRPSNSVKSAKDNFN